MSAEAANEEKATVSRNGWLRTVLVMAVPLAVAWGAAFWVTGMLWWRAPAPDEAAAATPPPASVHEVDSAWVDMPMYKRSNPQWHP